MRKMFAYTIKIHEYCIQVVHKRLYIIGCYSFNVLVISDIRSSLLNVLF